MKLMIGTWKNTVEYSSYFGGDGVLLRILRAWIEIDLILIKYFFPPRDGPSSRKMREPGRAGRLVRGACAEGPGRGHWRPKERRMRGVACKVAQEAG